MREISDKLGAKKVEFCNTVEAKQESILLNKLYQEGKASSGNLENLVIKEDTAQPK